MYPHILDTRYRLCKKKKGSCVLLSSEHNCIFFVLHSHWTTANVVGVAAIISQLSGRIGETYFFHPYPVLA